ncbi:MAG: hypothetical protein CVU19_02945 [Betaproteobacteria bacterium HGW-Betaproteobacteria-13]|jgi:transposase|nr:MAG: hypothetical protein CVU28_04620 [Betaproteobacteria bacterium HGW-Betaproteobacteria-21]PKO82205.1 MAG: hypothetical protein CVU19_02945 [Betaproteobacteria bacterium HGW-Betaproteobacteria-13]
MLVRTPTHKPAESLLGYVLRVSEENGYETPWHVLNHAAVRPGEMMTAGLPTAKLAAVLNIPPDALDGISYCGINEAGKREFRILGHSLGKSVMYKPLRLSQPAICPHCIAEHGHINAFFDLTIAVACPHHRCTLVHQCPSCNAPLSWFRPGLLTCKCGASLGDASTAEASPALVELMTALWALLHRQETLESVAGLPVQRLLEMRLRSLLLKLPAIGHWDMPESGRTTSDLVSAASEALADWPTGFHGFLSRVGRRATLSDEGLPGFGLRKQFDQLYNQLFRAQSCGSEFDWLRDEFVRFGLTEWGEAVVDKKLFRGEQCTRRYVSKAELAKRLGVSPVTLRKWHQEGLIELKAIPTKRQVRYVADSQDERIQPPAPAEGEVMETRAAAAYLGVPVSVLNRLKATGALEARHQLRQRHGFHRADLDAFRARLLALCPAPLLASQLDTVDFERILREYRFHNADHKAGFVEAVLNGQIKAIGRTGDTLAHIMFAMQDVAAYAASARSNEAGGSLTHREVVAQVHANADVVASLQKLGYLDTVKGRESLRVSQESVDAFNARYASLSGLASELGSSSKRLLSLCNRGDIAVLSIPRSQGSPAPFIERGNIAALQSLSQKFPARKPKAVDENRTVTAVKLYLTNLKALGGPLPRCGNKPNRRAIAMACGIDRSAFYNNQEITHLVDAYAASEDTGTDKPAPLQEAYALALNSPRLPLAA